MRILLLLILSINYCYSIIISDIPNDDACKPYLTTYKIRLSTPIVVQDVLQFVLNSGYADTNTKIGKYLLIKGYRNYGQYCIENICSKAIRDLIGMYRVKPQSIEKAYLDYTYIGKRQLDLANIDGIKAIEECSAYSKISESSLKLLLKDDYDTRLKQVVYGVSNIESKMENIVIQA